MPTRPTANQLERALELSQQIEKLEAELFGLLGTAEVKAPSTEVTVPAAPVSKQGKKGKRTFSAESRAKMAAAQKARWAKAGAVTSEEKPVKKAKGKRTLSPEAKARIGEAQKKRWAKFRKGK